MKAKQIQKQYKHGKRNFRGVDLKSQSFAEENLQEVDFSGADIRGAKFTNAELKGAIFSGADIRETNFTNAKLEGAVFSGAKAGLTPLLAISMSFISLILSTSWIALSSFILDWFWQNSFISIEEIIVYCTALLIAFPAFIFLILRKGAAAGLLFLPMTAIAAMLVVQVPSVAIAIVLIFSLVIVALFFVLGWRTFAIVPILLIFGWILLVFCFNFIGQSLVTDNTLSTQYNTLVRSLGTVLSITVTEALTLAISVTTLGCIGVPITAAVIMGVFIPVLLPLYVFLGNLPIEKIGSISLRYTTEMTYILIAILLAGLLGAYIGWRTLGEDHKYVLFRKIGIAFSTLIKCTKFRDADLTNANFTKAKLQNTDFTGAKTNLTLTNWFQAENLQRACVQGTYLQYSKVRNLLVKRTGKKENFDRLNLQGINCSWADLKGASLIGTNLSEANLGGADLSGAKLVQTQLFRANLQEAIITGAYIQDWEITHKTNIDQIKCDYLYLGLPTQRHQDPVRKPEQEQEKLKHEDLIELINDAEHRWQQIYSNFEELSNLKDTVIRERWEEKLIGTAKECGIPLARYRHMWQDYRDRQLTNQLYQSWWKIPLMRVELRVERLNRLLTQMDLFPILENMGRLSILIAVITFFVEIPQRRENSRRQKAETHYRAWEMIRESKDKDDRASSGRIIALQQLNKDGKTLANLEAPKATLSGIILSKANLTGANLTRAILNGAKLGGAKLDKTNLSGANLKNADLRNTNLYKAILTEQADLSGTNLSNANLTDADLTAAILNGAKLGGAILNGTNLSRADLRNVDLTNVKLDIIATLKGSIYDCNTKYDPNRLDPEEKGMIKIYNNAKLKNKNLRGKDLRGVDLSKADLSNANLSNTDLRNANLSEATLTKTKLDEALYNENTKFPTKDFNKSKKIYKIAPGVDLRGSDLSNKDLSGVDLSGADFRGADLSKVNLENTSLDKALYDHNTKFPPDFDKSNMYEIAPYTDLINADLSNADLSNADLSNAYLMNADLSNADLRDTILDKADLHNTNLVNAKGLKPKQVKSANNWEKAIYNQDFRKQLGLPVKESE